MKLTVGIDWGNKEHSVCVVDETGKAVFQKEYAHTGEALGRMAKQLLKLVDGDVQRLSVAIETPHGAVVETLLDQQVAVYYINPKQLDRFRDRYSVAGAKDDRLDAYVLGDTLRTDFRRYRRVTLDSPGRLQMRQMSRLYDTLTEQVVSLGSQIYHQLQRYMPLYWRLGDWHQEPWLWELFELAPTPQTLQKLRQSDVKKLLKRNNIRRYKPLELLQELQRQEPLTVAPGVPEAASAHILMLLPVLRATHLQRRQAERRLEAMLKPAVTQDAENKEHREAQLLLSLPGMGKHTGPVMLTEASDALRHRDYHALRRLCGVAPVSVRTGGRRKKPNVRMRRACNARLRTAVHHWVSVAIQQDPRTREHYQELRARGKSYGRALRGVADRLLKLLVSMLASDTPFAPERWNRKTRPQEAKQAA